MEGLSAEGWMASGLRCAVSAHQPSTRAFPAISCAKPTPCAAPPHGLGLPYGRNAGDFAPPRIENAALMARIDTPNRIRGTQDIFGEDERRFTRVADVFDRVRSEEHTSELQSLMRNSYAAYRVKQK